MAWQSQLKGDPGVRYPVLQDLKGLSDDDCELRATRKAAHPHAVKALTPFKMLLTMIRS